MTRLTVLRGYPGAGKTTIGRELERAGMGKFIDHNAILTFIANITGDDDGVYDNIAGLELAMTKKLLDKGADVIVARGFSSLEAMEPYSDIATASGAKFVVFRIDVNHDDLAKRVTSEERLSDFNPTVTREALDDWVTRNPIVDYQSEIIIDNTQPLATVVKDMVCRLSKE